MGKIERVGPTKVKLVDLLILQITITWIVILGILINAMFEPQSPDWFNKLDKDHPYLFKYRILRSIPHQQNSWTQGLIFYDGILIEGTGLTEGASEIRKIDPLTGRILRKIKTPDNSFGEGIALNEKIIYQITYNEQKLFQYRLSDLKYQKQVNIVEKNGWGLTSSLDYFYMTTGDQFLYVKSLEDFKTVKKIPITYQEKPLAAINELEYIHQKIFGNLWIESSSDKVFKQSNIFILDPESGQVEGVIDLSDLVEKDNKNLNGIAYDSSNGQFYITGKYWKKIYILDIF